MRLFLKWICLPVLAFFLQTPAFAQSNPGAPARAQTILIKAGKLVDVRAGRVLVGQAILIRGDRIVSVGPQASFAASQIAGARIIDLSNFTVLPGLIDTHTHLTADPGPSHFDYSPGRQALVGAKNANLTLRAGFTTVRNLGADNYSDVALRDAIAAGEVPGPRLLVSGPILSPTGGHADIDTFGPQFGLRGDGVADGVPAVIAKTREISKYGADWIKIVASGGSTSKGTSLDDEEYSDDEIHAIVAEAHRLGHKVAAHAHSTNSIKQSVLNGVDSIEHGTFIDDEGIALLKSHNVYLVPTLYEHDYLVENGVQLGQPDYVLAKARAVEAAAVPNIARAFRAGVKIAFGTDAGVYPHGLNAREFPMLLKIGMTPIQAIQSATLVAAQLLDRPNDIGALENGHFADVIAVAGDPTTDVATLEHVGFVMKGGAVVKDELTHP